MLVTSKTTATGFDEAAFAELLRIIKIRRDEFNANTHIPREVVDLMKTAGFYRAAAPACFGGTGVPPHLFLERIERIAQVDGSASWVAAFGSANTYYAALPYEAQKYIYADGPDQVFAGGLYPAAPAKRVEGGWKVSGRWRFASGCMGADWIAVGIADEGVNQVRMAVRQASEIKIIPNWEMIGMQGTGSYDTELTDCFVPDDWTCLRGALPIFDDPLYRYPLFAYQAQAHAASNLGLARAAIVTATEMAGGKKLMLGAARLADRAYFRTGLARAEAMLQSCRLYYYDAAEQAWNTIIRGDELSVAQRNALRLSATHAAHTAAKVIQLLYRITGMAAAEKSNRLQQLLRDSLVVTQHAALSEVTLELSGGALAGEKLALGFL
ncbi:acyl-CoA dehydrogenase [Acetobacter aceti]|uniref:Acyl-CoA dehydrogenase n=1 Tax=Acetobacter aceti TaxID=435 RepID=A0A1U9KK83_ACEAC|nr:acyl-CoA dehydrogenase [Acetobacter aceti]